MEGVRKGICVLAGTSKEGSFVNLEPVFETTLALADPILSTLPFRSETSIVRRSSSSKGSSMISGEATGTTPSWGGPKL